MYPWTITIYILTQYHANSWKLLILYPKKKVMSALPAPKPLPPKKKNKQQQTNEKYTNIVQPSGTSNNTSWNIWESSTLLIECLSVSSLLVCQSTLCLHLPQCSELTYCCLIILCYAKLFIKKNILLTMYYKENFMWNSIIVTTVRWIAINH
jgi:hypothetical protein